MPLDMQYGRKFAENALRTEIERVLPTLSEKQQDLFRRMYPNGPKPEQLEWALTQINNTVVKNKARSENEANSGRVDAQGTVEAG